jgi:hypothetical protein
MSAAAPRLVVFGGKPTTYCGCRVVYAQAVVTRVVLALALFAVGCGSGATQSGTAARAASCTDRLVKGAKAGATRPPEAAVRRYVMVTYCQPFARRGWVYEDGSLSIKAHLWVVRGTRESCETSTPGGKDKTVPCATLAAPGEPQMIDCALLHYVRRSEVRAYLTQLGGRRRVQCDDGTPLANLGVPSS